MFGMEDLTLEGDKFAHESQDLRHVLFTDRCLLPTQNRGKSFQFQLWLFILNPSLRLFFNLTTFSFP